MRLIWLSIFVSLFVGCGGDGGDSSEDATPTSLMCEHNGVIWACTEEGSCNPAEDIEYVEEAAEEEKLVKTTTGSIIIVAQCGSNVTFELPEYVPSND